MSQLGLGVMLGMLSGNESSVDAFNSCIGKLIKAVDFNEDRIILIFDDETKLKLMDDGQSCCESRYMTTDDDMQLMIGDKLVNAKVSDGKDAENEYGEVHETSFLHIETSKDVFVIETHNEHNGYYGGFLIRAFLVE